MIPLFATGLQPETMTYLRLPSPTLTQKAVNDYIRAVKYSSGVTLASTTLNISNPATSPLFLTNSSVDLRWLAGWASPPYITLTDGAAKTLKVLAGAAGSGETLDSELVTNGGLATDTTGWAAYGSPTAGSISSVAGGQTGNCLQHIAPASCTIIVARNALASLPVGNLYKASVYTKTGSGGTSVILRVFTNGTTNTDIQKDITTTASWVQSTAYGTSTSATVGSFNGIVLNPAEATTYLWDEASLKNVLTPDATGVTFTSPVVDAGFDYNAASYTCTITLT